MGHDRESLQHGDQTVATFMEGRSKTERFFEIDLIKAADIVAVFLIHCKRHSFDINISSRIGNGSYAYSPLKNVFVYRRPWLDRASVRDAISEYIEVFYNRIRRHSTIGNISPAKFEEMELAQAA
jgi:transposase InsO family protein